MTYFIDQDLRSQKTYISHTSKLEGKRFFILCQNMYEARKLLKDLQIGKIKGPMQSLAQYREIDPLPEARVFVFEPKGS